jgi:CRISPR-associated endoribonuclease Cas6
MRVKISFLRDHSSANSIPLHHQKLLTDSLSPFFESLTSDRTIWNFSSLKGTSKIMNGFMRMLSSKVTLVISGRNKEYLEQVIKMVFERPYISIGKMNLIPKNYDVIPDPDFQTKMRYLCISPLILHDPNKETDKAQEQIDPTSHAFSDILYNDVLDRMEKAGYTESQLNEFAEFEFMPDQDYVNKINTTGKKFARFYKCLSGITMMGYLLPFTLHAHPEVHKFVWEVGMGVLTEEGYGMVDIVK